jgi:hypothetical protein
MTKSTATDFVEQKRDSEMDAREVHLAMEHFSFHWAPSEPRKAAEFQADLLMLVQAVHRDSARPFADILAKAFSAMPSMIFHKSTDPNV